MTPQSPHSLWSSNQHNNVVRGVAPYHTTPRHTTQTTFLDVLWLIHYCAKLMYVQQEKELEQMLQWESKQKKVQVR